MRLLSKVATLFDAMWNSVRSDFTHFGSRKCAFQVAEEHHKFATQIPQGRQQCRPHFFLKTRIY